MAEPGHADLPARLRSDHGVGRLVRSIGLSEQFRFYLLAVDTPRVARAVFAILEEDVPVERGEAAHVVLLDPYRAHQDLDAPVPYDLLVNEVLAPLVEPSRAVASPRAIVVADASRALPPDDDAWVILFQRMNERRNLVGDRLGGALVLAVPPRLEPVFAHAAPDFWSIRSLAAVVDVALPMAAGSETLPTVSDEPSRDEEVTETGDAEEIEREIAAARIRLERSPKDASLAAELAIWLARRVEHELARGAPERALAAAEENVRLWREQLEHRPESDRIPYALSVGLDRVAVANEARGELDRALDAYEEARDLRLRLVERQPERPSWMRALADALENIGDVQRRRGELDRALRSHEDALGLRRRLAAREPSMPEWPHELARSATKVGDVQKARGDLERALCSYDEGLRLRRLLVAQDPERVDWLRGLSVSLGRIGDVHAARGQLGCALASHGEAVGVLRTLVTRESEHLARQRELVAGLSRVGDVHRARGDPRRAASAYDEGLRIMRSLAARDAGRAADYRAASARLEAALASTGR